MRSRWSDGLPCVLALGAALSAGAAALPDMPRDLCADAAKTVAAAAAVTRGDYPDADVVMVDDRLHTAYEADGSSTFWDDEWVKVLTERGRRRYAAVRVDYSLRYGDAAIQCVEIVGTNGVVRRVDFAKTLKSATDNSSTGANIYDPLDRTLSCAVPTLSVGETRHVRYCRRETKARMRGTWADTQLLEHGAPILRTVVTVDEPPARKIAHALLRQPCGQTVTRAPDRALANGRTRLTWVARRVPQMFPEPSMPPLEEAVQTLRLSTAPDWPHVSRWYWQLCRPRLAATSPELTNAVRRLTAPCKTPPERLRALFRFVSQEIRYMGLTQEDAAPGYEPHDVRQTFARRYGVCRDKAALLTAMLDAAGFEARPVLIRVGAKMDAEVPSPYFNHAIVAVRGMGPGDADARRPQGGWLLMDPTDEAARDLLPAYLSDCSYLVADPQGDVLRTSPVRPVSENLLKVVSHGTLELDGSAILTTRFDCTGINDTALRHLFVGRTEPARREALSRILQRTLPDATLLSCLIEPADLRDTETPLSISTVTRFPGVVLRGETCDALTLPLVTQGFSLVNALLHDNTALERRRFPLVLPTTAGSEEELTLTCGDHLGALRALPGATDLGRGAAFAASVTHALTDGVYRVTRRQTVRDVRFDVPAYGRLKDDLRLFEAETRADPLFAHRSAEHADVRTLLSRRDVRLASPHRWVETNTVVREILTYAGKKRSAELSFSWQPTVGTVEILSATVSNRTGEVHALAENEKNVLDASYVAAAPRYPAGRILVANLPGVEVGSVIRYTYVRTVTNAPLPFSTFTLMDSTEPLERKTLKVTCPDDMPLTWRTTGFDGCDRAVQLEDRVGATRRLAWSVTHPRRLKSEPSQPAASLWRRSVFVTAAPSVAPSLRAYAAALDAAAAGKRDRVVTLSRRIAAECAGPDERIMASRRALTTFVRTAGPSLFALPPSVGFTEPDRILADGYATRADRANLMRVLLEELGFSCRFVFASGETAQDNALSRLYAQHYPRPEFFDALVLVADDGERVWYLNGENEYTPPACSSCENMTFFDPKSEELGRITLDERLSATWYAPWTWGRFTWGQTPETWGQTPETWGQTPETWGQTPDVRGLSPHARRQAAECRMTVHADGGVDFDMTQRVWGASVGSFRKRYVEMLPEIRSRHFQELLGDLAESATATRLLETDVTGYPAVRSFAAFVPMYAVVTNGLVTLRVPDLDDELVSLGSGVRHTPILMPACDESVETVDVLLPPRYEHLECLPTSWCARHPQTGAPWMTQTVTTRRQDGRRAVRIVRRTHRRDACALDPSFAPYVRAWNERLAARSEHILSIRR